MSAQQATNHKLKDEKNKSNWAHHASSSELQTVKETNTTNCEWVEEQGYVHNVMEPSVETNNVNTSNINELATSTSTQKSAKVANSAQEEGQVQEYEYDIDVNVNMMKSEKEIENKEKESAICTKHVGIIAGMEQEGEYHEKEQKREQGQHNESVMEMETVKEEISEVKQVCEEPSHVSEKSTEHSANLESTESSERNVNNTNLFIRNLSPEVDQNDLESVFRSFGKILSSVVMRNIYTGVSLGTAFVRFETHEQAERAMHTLNNRVIAGRPFCIQWANKHEGAPVGEARKKIHKLFVRNIPFDLTVEQLREFFSQFGPVIDVTIHNDTAKIINKNLERRISFVTFDVDGAADKAAKAIHNTQPFASCNNIPLMVKLAEDVYNKPEHRRRQHHQSNNMQLYSQAQSQVEQQQRQTRPSTYSFSANSYYTDSISYGREYSLAQPSLSSSSAAAAPAANSLYNTNRLCTEASPSSNIYGNQELYAVYDENKTRQMSYWDNSRNLSSAVSSTPAITTNAYTELTVGNETHYYTTSQYSMMQSGGGGGNHNMHVMGTPSSSTATTAQLYNQNVPIQVESMYNMPSIYGNGPSSMMYDINSTETVNAPSSNVNTLMYMSCPPFSPSPPEPIVMREQSQSYYQPSTSFLRAEEGYSGQPYVTYTQEYNPNYINSAVSTIQPNIFAAAPSVSNMNTGYYSGNIFTNNNINSNNIVNDNTASCPTQVFDVQSQFNMQTQMQAYPSPRRPDTSAENVAGAGTAATVSLVRPNVMTESTVTEYEQCVCPPQANTSSQIMHASPAHALPYQENVQNIHESGEVVVHQHHHHHHHHLASHNSPYQANASRHLSFSRSTSNSNVAMQNANDSNWLRPVAEYIEQPLPTLSPLRLDDNPLWEQQQQQQQQQQQKQREHQKIENVLENKNVKCFDSPLKAQASMEANVSAYNRNRGSCYPTEQSLRISSTADDLIDNVINVPQTSFQFDTNEQTPSLHSNSSISEVPLKMTLPTYSKSGQKLVHHLSLNEYSSSSGKERYEADTSRVRLRESSMGSPNQSYRHNPYSLTSSILICEDKVTSGTESMTTCLSATTNDSTSKPTTEPEIANQSEEGEELQKT